MVDNIGLSQLAAGTLDLVYETAKWAGVILGCVGKHMVM